MAFVVESRRDRVDPGDTVTLKRRPVRWTAAASTLAVCAILSAPGLSERGVARGADPVYTGLAVSDEQRANGEPTTVEFDPVQDLNETFSAQGKLQIVTITIPGWKLEFGSGAEPFHVGEYVGVHTNLSAYDPSFTLTHAPYSYCGFGAEANFTIVQLPAALGTNASPFAADFEWRCMQANDAHQAKQWLHGSVRVAAATAPEVASLGRSIAFPDTTMGNASIQTVLVQGVGTGSVSIPAISVAGVDPTMFGIENDGCSGNVVTAHGTCSFDVRFAPSATTARSAMITIEADPPTFSHTFGASGVGRSAILQVPSSLLLISDPGEWIGSGKTSSFGTPDLSQNDYHDQVAVHFPSGGTAAFSPPDGQALVIGHYDVPSWPPTAGSLSVSGFGHGCNEYTGSFDVVDAPVYDIDGVLLRVGVDFEQHCDGSPLRLRGTLRFHSTVQPKDFYPPKGEIKVVGGSAVNDQNVSLDVTATDASGVSEVSLSNDGTTWTVKPYAARVPWVLSPNDGAKTVFAKWRDPSGNWSAAKSTSVVLDRVAPSGTLSIAGGVVWTRTAAITLSTPGSDAGSGISLVRLSNNGFTTWVDRVYSATQAWTLFSANGTRTVWARWKDGAGNWSAAKTDTIILDTVAPYLVKALPMSLGPAGTALVGGAMPVSIGWTWYEGGSGIARYNLSQSVDGSAYSSISTTLTTPTVTRNLLPGHQYSFASRAYDRAGNFSPWGFNVIKLTGLQQTSSRIAYHGTWTTSTSTTWWGGTAKGSSSAGATASLTFTDRQFAWIGIKASNRGKAQVYVNGILTATVDLYSATLQKPQVLWRGVWSTNVTRTVTIKVLGTVGRPRIDVDGFFTRT